LATLRLNGTRGCHDAGWNHLGPASFLFAGSSSTPISLADDPGKRDSPW
jgi:hypothetical protein